MKRIAIAMLFWMVCPALMGQITNNQAPVIPAQSRFTQDADLSLANLDKSGVTSGVLYNRTFPMANLLDPTASSSPGHFRQAHAELYAASYDKDNRISPDDLKSLLDESELRQVVPIGILLARMQHLNTNVVELDNNEQYRLKSGYNADQMYQTAQVAVASAG
jgi:hypothetical protein